MPERWQLVIRAAAALTVLAAVSWGWSRFGGDALKAYDAWRYPAVKPSGTLGAAMKRDLDGVRRAELTAQYKRVMEGLDEAERNGFIVGGLREKLPDAARMIRAGYFDFARVLLASVETRIPRKREVLAPASHDPDSEDEPTPKPASRPATAPKASPAGRRRR